MKAPNSLINQAPFEFISPVNSALVVKILVVAGLIVYIIFAFILTRQVSIKRSTVETPLGPTLSLIATTHLIASILLVIGAFVVL